MAAVVVQTACLVLPVPLDFALALVSAVAWARDWCSVSGKLGPLLQEVAALRALVPVRGSSSSWGGRARGAGWESFARTRQLLAAALAASDCLRDGKAQRKGQGRPAKG